MKRYYILISACFIFVILSLLISHRESPIQDKNPSPTQSVLSEENTWVPTDTPKANPASTYCVEHGGEIEIIVTEDDLQFSMCKFADYSCEEGVYFRGECTVEQDAEKIREALIAKGLDLTGMKVDIYKHLGKYISGGVVPVSGLGGGGYVFAVKEEGVISIVADGNGVIACSAFANYPDFPSYLVSECVGENGSTVER